MTLLSGALHAPIHAVAAFGSIPVEGHHCVRRVLPVQECRKNPNTVLAVTDIGGHCAHLQGLWPFGTSYIDDSAVHFCKAVLSSSLHMQAEQ